jgi:outer membrane receptor protein involved in Fe transport
MLAAGLPRLDLLDGDAIGNSGGVSRHRIEAQGGVSKNGLGMRFSANWQNGTSVRGVSDTLHFGSLTTVDLRLFANLGLYKNMGRTHPWLRGAQVFIGVNNIFNAKQDVRTSAGLVPSGYVPDQMDAQGRTVRITFRKLFMSFRPRS